MNKRKLFLHHVEAILLLFLGLLSLVVSITYAFSILAFIGLGLTFWGVLFFYITPSKHVKIDLLNPTVLSSLANIDQIMTELNCKGKGVYLPPKYLGTFDSGKVFLSSLDNTSVHVPRLEEIEEGMIFLKNPNGVLLIPPGLALTQLFEKELGMNFTKTDMEYLQVKLPKLFIEDLEIAEELKIEIEHNVVKIEIIGSIYQTLCNEAGKFRRVCDLIGCPVTSALACAIAKASGKPVIIEKEEKQLSEKIVRIQYQILEEETQ